MKSKKVLEFLKITSNNSILNFINMFVSCNFCLRNIIISITPILTILGGENFI